MPAFFALLIGSLLACGGVGPTEPELVMPASIEEAEELCKEEDRAGCLYLAELFENDRDAREAHPDVFLTYSTSSCNAGLGASCYELGFVRLTGKGGRVDKKEAGELLQKGCDAGDGRSCFTGGIQARRGDGVGRNPKRALKMLERACELLKDFQSCAEVGQMWTTDEIRDAPNLETSKAFYAKACENEPTHPFCGGEQR